MEIETRKNIFIALRMAGVAGLGKLDGKLQYVDGHKLNWNIQLVRAAEYEYKDRRQSARRIRVPAMRGEIFSREGSAMEKRPLKNSLTIFSKKLSQNCHDIHDNFMTR